MSFVVEQVQETKLEKAIAALKNNFNITTEGDTAPTDPAAQEATFSRVCTRYVLRGIGSSHRTAA
jgi:hypothetical protein